MKTYDIYTAVAIQSEIKAVEKREDIRRNLKRSLELIDAAPQVQPTAKEHYRGNWAPIKLISFPEFLSPATKATGPSTITSKKSSSKSPARKRAC